MTETAPRTSRTKTIGLRLAKGAVAILLLVWLFAKVPFSQVMGVLGQADWSIAMLVFLAVVLMQWLTAIRLKLLLDPHGMGMSIWRVFDINLVTLFYGLFLPGGNVTGIAIYIARMSGLRKDHALPVGVALLLDRVLVTFVLACVGVICWLIEWPTGQASALALMVAGGAGLGGVLLLLIGPREAWGLGSLRRMVSRWRAHRLEVLSRTLHDQATLPRGHLCQAVLLSVVIHVIGVLAYWGLAQAIGLDVSIVTIGWVRSAIILVSMIPLTMSGLGLREGASILILAQYPGVAQADAMGYALLVFGVTVLAIGLLGGLLEARRLVR